MDFFLTFSPLFALRRMGHFPMNLQTGTCSFLPLTRMRGNEPGLSPTLSDSGVMIPFSDFFSLSLSFFFQVAVDDKLASMLL